jgi:hypothetical protein
MQPFRRAALTGILVREDAAPHGHRFCDGCRLNTAREGHLFFGSFNAGDTTR